MRIYKDTLEHYDAIVSTFYDILEKVPLNQTQIKIVEENFMSFLNGQKTQLKASQQIQQMPLIIMEGIDGSGKATQRELLANHLDQDGVPQIKPIVPNYDLPQSLLVMDYLSGRFGNNAGDVDPYLASFFYSIDRYVTNETEIKPVPYQSGSIIVADRWTTSNILYQTTKIEGFEEKRKFIDWINNLEYETFGLAKPSLTFLFLITIEDQVRIVRERLGNNKTGREVDIHEIDTAYQAAVTKNAAFVADYLDWDIVPTYYDEDKTQRKPIEEVHDYVYKKTIDLINSNK